MRKAVTHFSPLPSYSAQGGLRQAPGRAAESPAEVKTYGVGVANACVVVGVWAARDVDPVLGLVSQLATGLMPAGVWP